MFENEYYTIFVQVMTFPRRKMILKQLADKHEYIKMPELINLKDWDILCAVNEALYEPVEIWWTESEIAKHAFNHSIGVEVPMCYCGAVPTGFEIIQLSPCKMMTFQGNIININKTDFHTRIDEYDPRLYGFEWANEEAPRIRLAPINYRGYIEARPVRLLFDN